MILELGKFVSLAASILSLCSLMGSAFFVPASTWQDRLIGSLVHIALAGCLCFASGILFREDALRHAAPSGPNQSGPNQPAPSLTETLPVRLFFWSLLAMSLLFLLSWFLETWYVPQLWRNQP